MVGKGRKAGSDTERRGDDQRRRDDSVITDSEAHQAYVKQLYAKISHKLRTPVETEVQIEIGDLIRLASTMPPRLVNQRRADFEIAFDILAADEPNLALARSIRVTIESASERSGIISGLISRIAGTTPVQALVSALTSILILSFLVVFLLSQLHVVVHSIAKDALNSGLGADLPMFAAIKEFPIGQFLMFIHASFLGSIASIITRMEKFLNAQSYDTVVIFISIVSKPLVSGTFALFVFFASKAGLISFIGADLASPAGPYLAWVLGFLCGFSERLVQDFVSHTAGPFGGSRPPSEPSKS